MHYSCTRMATVGFKKLNRPSVKKFHTCAKTAVYAPKTINSEAVVVENKKVAARFAQEDCLINTSRMRLTDEMYSFL